MALAYTYFDAYLKQHVTEERETRAAAEVAEAGSFATDWTSRLTVARTYIVTCLECQAQPDDLFAQKLKNYRDEYASILAQARQATVDNEGKPLSVFTVSLERA